MFLFIIIFTKKIIIKLYKKMDEEENEAENFKIVLIGETGVGKTSIISQFVDDTFQEDLQASTGGTFSSKTLILDEGKALKFDIWDTAGQERYRSLTKLFYKDSNAAILVYDITRHETFDELKNYWINQIKESTNTNIILVIAANKSDLTEKEEVDEAMARQFAEELNALFCKTSAKDSIGIDDLFFNIAKKYKGKDILSIKKEQNKDEKSDKNEKQDDQFCKTDTMKLSLAKTYTKKKKKCC